MNKKKHGAGCSCLRCKIAAEANYAKTAIVKANRQADRAKYGGIHINSMSESEDDKRFWADFLRVNQDAK